MRLATFMTTAITAPAALAAQQGSSQPSPVVPMGPESPLAMWITPESTVVDPIRPSRKLATVAAEKPVMEASMMGLIVFSAAGLFLL